MPGWFSYSPNGRVSYHRSSLILRSARAARSGGFVSVELNVAGWISILLPGAVLGAVIGWAQDWPLMLPAAVGSLLTWLSGVIVDRGREPWRLCQLQVPPLNESQVLQVIAAAKGSRIRTIEHHLVSIDPWVAEIFEPGEERTHDSVFRVQRRHIGQLRDIVTAVRSAH